MYHGTPPKKWASKKNILFRFGLFSSSMFLFQGWNTNCCVLVEFSVKKSQPPKVDETMKIVAKSSCWKMGDVLLPPKKNHRKIESSLEHQHKFRKSYIYKYINTNKMHYVSMKYNVHMYIHTRTNPIWPSLPTKRNFSIPQALWRRVSKNLKGPKCFPPFVHPEKLTFWTKKWRLGKWFSVSNRWFLGSMSIFRGEVPIEYQPFEGWRGIT